MKGGEVTRDLPLCSCGERPVLIWHYIKGRANVINYLVKCEYCRKRTRNRKHGADAVKEWESMIMKQTNLEWLNSLISSEKRVREFDLQYDEFRNAPDGDNYNAVNKVLLWLSYEHIEPIVLTPEERKAAELAVAIGLPWIRHWGDKKVSNVMIASDNEGLNAYGLCEMPNVRILGSASWITAEPIDLRTLLKETT